MNPTPITPELREAARDVRLVVVDMDGTLLDEHTNMPAEIWDVIDRLAARGIALVPGSGRQYATLADQFAPVLDKVPIIAENGALTMQAGEVLHMEPLPRQAALNVIDIVRNQTPDSTSVLVCGRHAAYTDSVEPRFVHESTANYRAYELLEDVTSYDDDVMKIAIFDRVSSADNAFPAFGEIAEDFEVVVSGQCWMDVMQRGVTKGFALGKLQEALGVAPAQTVVFGDFLNDIEMLARADFSFAMANAHPDVLAASRYVAPRNSENGVVRVIEQLLLS